jgi:hypothetical protein
MALGRSFAPNDDPTSQRRGPSPAPIQEAIRVMSLQMPRVVGANSPNPAALMSQMGGQMNGGQGLGGPTSNPIIEQLLRALFGGGGQQGGQMPGLPGAPAPPSAPPNPGFGWINPTVNPTPAPGVPQPPAVSQMAEQPSKAPAVPMSFGSRMGRF